MSQEDSEVVLRLPEVARRVGLRKTAIYKLLNEGDFPAPIRLTDKARGWTSASVAEWIQRRVDEAKAKPAP